MSVIAHSDLVKKSSFLAMDRGGSFVSFSRTNEASVKTAALDDKFRVEYNSNTASAKEFRLRMSINGQARVFGLLGFRASAAPYMIRFSNALTGQTYTSLYSGEVSAEQPRHQIVVLPNNLSITTAEVSVFVGAAGSQWFEFGRFWASPALDVDFERDYPIGYESHIKAHYPPNGGAPMFTGGDRPAARQVAFGVAEVDSDHALGINHSGFAAPSINSLHDFIQHHKTSGDHFICMPRTANPRDLQKTAIYGHMADDSATIRTSGDNNTWRAEFKVKETT